MLLTGADIVIECLLEQGVDTVFGYPGGTILNVYDSLYHYRDRINHVLTSHEQGASHAADGYARATGKVGVCMATSGPGATNLVTGIATAYMDSVPLVAITANVGVPLLGKDSFQEVDITGVTMPITKHNYIVKDVESLAPTIRKAFQIAKEGRPGPVLVDITKDVTAAKCEYHHQKPEKIERRSYTYPTSTLKEAIEMIEKSEKPFVFVGGGVVRSNASQELREFVEKIDAPVTDSLMGKGAFDGTNPRYTGMLGMHGTKTSNLGVSNCDLLVAIGVRFSDRVIGNAQKFARHAKIIHIDVDEAEINKNVNVDLGIVGDAKSVLNALNLLLKQQNHSQWLKEIRALKEQYPLSYDSDKLTGPYVIEQIEALTDNNAIICTEVGQNQMWAAQYYHFKRPSQLITSGGLGTMGYGLGASIGVKYGKPDQYVFNIAGDGCFRMNMNELATASRYQVPIIEVILNNHVLGMVRQWQTLFYGKRYSATVLDDKVDFCKTAEGLGCKAIRVTKKEEVAPAILEAMDSQGPVVIECMIEEDDKVFPMVAPGAPIDDVFDQNDIQE
ncbi:acetolactate synthase, large subunit, biosynthetic type [Massilimicrobiota sp. An142]|uniref:biosynthetic-type acetolactate synthase large subunit n=1 Tax=unclassified Massilimicrobiota TaxID=2619866 RepID=UPI000B37F64F|nr:MULTISPECIES: biosynthetic-type acetolactate synthase large subunit [unclassified Massilimicrobiota]OUN38057.1 acetolactate synthase, large subunit, biosynthetic type [Massilimicrobiota sp. An80]OUQ13685.1 acetolactate synthase, large subunit, biosynthetic type [Massilimicrobiota sp. An142]